MEQQENTQNESRPMKGGGRRSEAGDGAQKKRRSDNDNNKRKGRRHTNLGLVCPVDFVLRLFGFHLVVNGPVQHL